MKQWISSWFLVLVYFSTQISFSGTFWKIQSWRCDNWKIINNQIFFYQHIIFRSYLHDIRWLLSSPACSPQHVTIDSFYYSFVLFTNFEYGSPFRTKRWTLINLVKNSLSPIFCISYTRVSKAVWSSIYCFSVVWVRL